MGYVMSRSPQLLSYSMDEVRTRVKFFTDMDMKKKDFCTMVFQYPRVLGYFSLEEMNQKVRFFQDIGIEDAAIGNMLAKYPPLLTYSLQKKIRAVVVFFTTRAGVSQTDIATVIASGPELLGCSIVHKLDINVKVLSVPWHTTSSTGGDDCRLPHVTPVQHRSPPSKVSILETNDGWELTRCHRVPKVLQLFT